MDRIAVIGTAGSGKTTLCRIIAKQLNFVFCEMDSLRHQPNWVEMPDDKFLEEIDTFTQQDKWVIDGNYSITKNIVWSRADTIVWIDLPKWLVMVRVIRRSAKRFIFREQLWNGNRETLVNLLSWNPEKSIIVWSWKTYKGLKERNEKEWHNHKWSSLSMVRLRSRTEVSNWIATLGKTG